MNTVRQRRLALASLFASIVLSSLAQLLMKAGTIELAAALDATGASWVTLPTSEIVRAGLLVLSGLLCYALSMLSWLIVLSRYDLSFAYPMLGLSYVLVYAVAAWMPYFGEAFNVQRLAGIGLIIAGVALVAAKQR